MVVENRNGRLIIMRTFEPPVVTEPTTRGPLPGRERAHQKTVAQRAI